MATLGIYASGILLTCPTHLHLLFFTSNEMGINDHPSSLVEFHIAYLVWPKDVQHSSKALVLKYFQHVAYS